MNCPKCNSSIKVKSGKTKGRQRTKINPNISWQRSVEKAQSQNDY